MMLRLGHGVCTGVPLQVAGDRILTGQEEMDLDALGSYVEDVPIS